MYDSVFQNKELLSRLSLTGYTTKERSERLHLFHLIFDIKRLSLLLTSNSDCCSSLVTSYMLIQTHCVWCFENELKIENKLVLGKFVLIYFSHYLLIKQTLKKCRGILDRNCGTVWVRVLFCKSRDDKYYF